MASVLNIYQISISDPKVRHEIHTTCPVFVPVPYVREYYVPVAEVPARSQVALYTQNMRFLVRMLSSGSPHRPVQDERSISIARISSMISNVNKESREPTLIN